MSSPSALDTDLDLPPLPPTVLPLSDLDGQRLARLHDVPRSPTERCITCGARQAFPKPDDGRFRWWNAQRTEVVSYRCDCVGQWVLHRWLLNSGVPLNYQRLGWADTVGVEPQAQAVVADYLAHLDPYVTGGYGLVLHGNMGTGKTLLSSLLLKTVMLRGYSGYFGTFERLIDSLRQSWDDKDREWFHRRIKDVDVLVIDDLGREHKQRVIRRKGEEGDAVQDLTTTTATSILDEVLRWRLAQAKPTVLTTNLPIDRLGQAYGAGVTSLLAERCRIHEFTAEDWRPSAGIRFDDEVRQGLQRPVVLG